MRRLFLALSLCVATIGTVAPAAAQDVAETRAALKAGVARLDFLAGPWVMSRYTPTRDGGWTERETQAVAVERSMNDLYLTTTFTTPGFSYEMVFSFDTAMDAFRIVSRDDQSGLIDVYEGGFEPDETLVVTNLHSGTHFVAGDRRIHNRMTFSPRPGGWSLLVEGTADEGATWSPQGRVEARRPG